jgi:hypothetical protein
MRNLLFVAILGFCFFGLLVPAQAQESDAASKLADAAMPQKVLFETLPDCFDRLSSDQRLNGLSPKEAAKFCLEARKVEAKRAKETADATARALKAKAKAEADAANPCRSIWNPPAWCVEGYIGGVYSMPRSGVAYGANGVAGGRNR